MNDNFEEKYFCIKHMWNGAGPCIECKAGHWPAAQAPVEPAKAIDMFVPTCSKRADDWLKFSTDVYDHIEKYTVPQYGDKGTDLASAYTAEDCVKAINKYSARFGKNSRPGQELQDLMKIAHYAQMAYEILKAKNGN